MKGQRLNLQAVEGIVEKELYVSPEGNFAIYLMRQKDGQLLKILGNFAGDLLWRQIKCQGKQETDPKFGQQFRVQSWQMAIPKSSEELERLLAGGLFPGIGAKRAALLIEKFGEELVQVLTNRPQEILTVKGIGKRYLKEIIAVWQKLRGQLDIRRKLAASGLGLLLADKVVVDNPKLDLEQLSQNPYKILQQTKGISFIKADSVAAVLGIKKDSSFRLAAGLKHCLQEAESEGHVFLPESELLVRADNLLAVKRELIAKQLELELDNRKELLAEIMPGQGRAIYLRSMATAEKELARDILRLISATTTINKKNIERLIVETEKKLSLSLNQRQKEAVKLTLENKLTIVSGGPGTGKTTIIKVLAELLQQLKIEPSLAAPTGRAAKRIEELSGFRAKTIHRLLEYSPQKNKFSFNRQRKLSERIIIVDETSMVDLRLMHALLQAIPASSQLLLIGDHAQLPSIGAGNVFRNLIDSNRAAIVNLEEVYRQQQGSLIRHNAHLVRHGKMPILNRNRVVANSDFIFHQLQNEAEIPQLVWQYLNDILVKERKYKALTEIQVLTPVNRGLFGTLELNKYLQQRLNLNQGVALAQTALKEGDKVIQTRNNYDLDIYNGELGEIIKIEKKLLKVLFAGRIVEYKGEQLNDLTLAYAISIHKSQGSEYKAVIVILPASCKLFLQRNLFYTALTRAKEVVVVISEIETIKSCLKNEQFDKRYSLLLRRLKGSSSKELFKIANIS